MADKILEETQTEGTTETTPETTPSEGITEGTQTEGTTGNGYLTKPYLVRNLQTFWSKIKVYITDKIKDFADKSYVTGAVDNALKDTATKTDLEALTNKIDAKAEASALTALETVVGDKIDQNTLDNALEGKVDVEPGKGLSTKDFTADYENKLKGLKNYSVVNDLEDVLMSVTYKAKLDSIDEGATAVTVDSDWIDNSENPVQSKLIRLELANKVDKETDPVEPPDLEDSKLIQGYVTDEGSIVLTFPQNTKHLKIYAPKSDRPIEKVSLWDGSSLLFTNFRDENGNWAITIENPNGTGEQISFGESFDFYIESLETIGNPKYKPFILQVTRLNEMTTEVGLTITKIL